jgi:hypothetical protein
MDRPVHLGAQRLEDAGLIAFTRCGHWWVYPNRATLEQMHDLDRFNHGIVCGFCLATWQDATHARACGTAGRVN